MKKRFIALPLLVAFLAFCLTQSTPMALAAFSPAPHKTVRTTHSATPTIFSWLNAPRLEGMDVSYANTISSFGLARKSGRVFVFIKATEGTTIQDPKFAGFRSRAESVGLIVSPYHLLTPWTDSQSQFNNFQRVVGKPRPGELPVAVDVEPDAGWLNLSHENRILRILHFATLYQKATGAKPIIYVSAKVLAKYIGDDARLHSYALWIADYQGFFNNPGVPGWNHWTFWQYTSSGKVPGANGNVDLDRYNGAETDLQKLAFAAPAAHQARTPSSAKSPTHKARITSPTKSPTHEARITNPAKSPTHKARITSPTKSPTHKARITSPTKSPTHKARITNPTKSPTHKAERT